ncbi:MAG TPA: ATP-binding protein [Casimicrobiaceae bacterium]|nr:ATP-binding protein [Casimicrobiaceae bacterium]
MPRLPRIALGIRAQLLLVLTVFLALPWLGYEYVRELERFLREAQESTLAGTAQAVATALHGRPRLFAAPADPIASFARDRSSEDIAVDVLPPAASPEIEQIIGGLSRTTARIWVVDRDLTVLARAGSLKRPPLDDPPAASALARGWQMLERNTLHRLYARMLDQPTEEFRDDASAQGPARGRDIDGALAGILTTDRRTTSDGKAVIVSAAHPIWIGDDVRGAVIVEETTNRVLAERNRAFERLFNIVLAALLLGSVALTLFASRLSNRIRRLRDDAEAAIDAHGRALRPLASSTAGDEIGDLSRSFSDVLARLSHYAQYQEKMASRLGHELRTPVAVVRSSLENLNAQALPQDARVYIERARGGIERLTAILTRMTEAARLEQALKDAEKERFDLAEMVGGCVEGYRTAYAQVPFEVTGVPTIVVGAPDLIAQMLDKLIANAVEFRTSGPVRVGVSLGEATARLTVANNGPRLPDTMAGRLFDSMVSMRASDAGDVPHLGLGLYIARLVAEFHGGSIRADNLEDGSGVVVTVVLPLAPIDARL